MPKYGSAKMTLTYIFLSKACGVFVLYKQLCTILLYFSNVYIARKSADFSFVLLRTWPLCAEALWKKAAI